MELILASSKPPTVEPGSGFSRAQRIAFSPTLSGFVGAINPDNSHSPTCPEPPSPPPPPPPLPQPPKGLGYSKEPEERIPLPKSPKLSNEPCKSPNWPGLRISLLIIP